MAPNCIFVGAMVTLLDVGHCSLHLVFLFSLVLLSSSVPQLLTSSAPQLLSSSTPAENSKHQNRKVRIMKCLSKTQV